VGIDPMDKGPGYYLQMGSLNNNSIANIAGIQGKYFVTNRFALNAMFAMQIDVTPQRDYTEGINLESSAKRLVTKYFPWIPAMLAIELLFRLPICK